MNLKSKKGFTLVELIIVIAILGIIALIAVPSLTGIQQRSQVNADIRTAEQIGKAVRIWLTDTGAGVDREALISADWVQFDEKTTGDTLTSLDEYISRDYIPNSALNSDEHYYIRLVKGSTTTGIDRRVVVAIGTPDDLKTIYTKGEDKGIAYCEGISELSATKLEDTISAI